eukprot:scaffold72208_cov63-Phaeocystis_antarctica.AAC.4
MDAVVQRIAQLGASRSSLMKRLTLPKTRASSARGSENCRCVMSPLRHSRCHSYGSSDPGESSS